MVKAVDLNCDLGEIEGPEGESLDQQMMQYVSSVNVACGGHAGCESRIRKVVEWAISRGVAIGAHPGYADRINFGRMIVPMSAEQICTMITEQVNLVATVARELGGKLHHVKPHGALYNLAATSRETADAIVHAVRDCAPECCIVGLAGSQLIFAAESAGLQVVNEAFADRNYAADGTLLLRQHPEAVLHEPVEIALRAVSMVETAEVTAIDGTQISLRCDSLCLHSDSPAAIRIAEALVSEFSHRGIVIRAIQSN